ncbi:MAG: sulfite exporter TauE/SafE family protein [Burkholderiaceae bacterium]
MPDLLASTVVFVAALVQAVAGVGFAMISVPLLALLDPTLVPGPMLIGMLTLSMVMAGTGLGSVNPREFAVLIPALLVGTVIGAPIVRALSSQALALILGILLLIAVAISLAGASATLNRKNLGLGGVVSGLMGTVTGIHGPPLAVLYSAQAPDKARSTIAWIFVFGTVMSLVALRLTGQLPGPALARGLNLIPGVLIGYIAAHLVKGMLAPAQVRMAMLLITAASALILIANNLA